MGMVCTISVCYDFCSFRYQYILDKYYNDQPQQEEKAREELADHCIKTGVDPAIQLMRSGIPASLKEDVEGEHALYAFYAEMILWNLGVVREVQVFGYACLKFIEMLQRKCLSKSTTNTFGNRVSHQGPWGEGTLFPLLTAQ